MRSIFISYRRDDTAGYGGRLHEVLAAHFGPRWVFRDIDAIQPGIDFVRTIEEAVAGSGAVVALIGRDWLTITDREGHRRLDDPDDFVRLEIASALENGIDVIPVLVEGAHAPPPDALPGPIAKLGRLQAIEITEERWSYDVGRLVSRLEQVVGAPGATPVPVDQAETASPQVARATRTAVRVLAGLALLVVIVVAVLVSRLPSSGDKGEGGSGTVPPPADQSKAVEVNKTVWYGGFKVALGRATLHTVGGSRLLDVPVILENQGERTVELDNTIFVSSKGQNHELGDASELPSVPGRTTGKGALSFDVGNDFSLSDAVITFGRADKAQAVVPLGSSGALQLLQPLQLTFTRTMLTAGVLSLEVRAGQVRADDPSQDYAQAGKGHHFLILDIASLTTTEEYGSNVVDANIVVKLPDGTTVAADGLDVVPYPDKPVRDFHASYLVNDPPAGTYSLILRDTSEARATAAAEFKVG